MYIINLLFDNNQITREGLLRVGAFVIALLITVMLHEIAHGLGALAFGDKTAKEYGRLTLNPTKHFDLVGLGMMLIVGFGWARPVPVNVNNFNNKRTGMIVVSLAGVITNLLLAFVFALFFVLLGNVKVVTDSALYYLVYFGVVLSLQMLMLNINFALFNILPLFPLDGYRLLSCYLPQHNSYMVFVRKYSLYILLGLLALQYLPIIGQWSPIALYIGEFGELIRNAFVNFWRLLV